MPRGRTTRFWLIASSVSVVLLAGLVLALGLAGNRTPAFLTRIEPNGYEMFLRAAAALNEGAPAGMTNKFASLVTMNEEALWLWRKALEHPTETPVQRYDFASSPNQMQTFMDELGQFKKLAMAVKAAGVRAESGQKFDQAAEYYLDLIRMGLAIEHGPQISFLTGLAIERIGLDALGSLTGKLSAEQKAGVSAKLNELNKKRIPYEEIVKRENYLLRRNAPTPIHSLVMRHHPSRKNSIEAGRGRYESWEQQMAKTAQELSQR